MCIVKFAICQRYIFFSYFEEDHALSLYASNMEMIFYIHFKALLFTMLQHVTLPTQ